jgi:hypothetical protein
MNFRVFLLIGAITVFGALWSSDRRYQAEQVTLARTERARSSNANTVLTAGGNAKLVDRITGLVPRLPLVLQPVAPPAPPISVPKTQPIHRDVTEAATSNALVGRLLFALALKIDPGNSLNLVADRANRAKSRLEEHVCLVRFRTRQGAFFAGRRLIALLRATTSAQKSGRFARIIIREIPVEETLAPAAEGRQTR